MLKIILKEQPNGTYRLIYGHPAFGLGLSPNIYQATDVAKFYVRNYPLIFDGITVESLVDSSL